MKPHVSRSDDDIIVSCGECYTKHVLKFHTFGRYYLDNTNFTKVLESDDNDEFVLDGEMLSPIWVCRNFQCTSESKIRVPPEKHDLETA
jgi:hypothetical protein